MVGGLCKNAALLPICHAIGVWCLRRELKPEVPLPLRTRQRASIGVERPKLLALCVLWSVRGCFSGNKLHAQAHAVCRTDETANAEAAVGSAEMNTARVVTSLAGVRVRFVFWGCCGGHKFPVTRMFYHDSRDVS